MKQKSQQGHEFQPLRAMQLGADDNKLTHLSTGALPLFRPFASLVSRHAYPPTNADRRVLPPGPDRRYLSRCLAFGS